MDIREMAADMIDYDWGNGMDTTTIWIREWKDEAENA